MSTKEQAMNLQEREQLSQFLQQLVQAQAGQKDAEAETLIKEACARQPEASYLLVQRALLLDHALQNAQAQVARLQGELAQAQGQQRSGGFLDNNAWGNAPARAPQAAPVYAQAPAPAYAAAAAPAPAASSWGSTLGSVATTAAGVAAGAFLFQGIEHLMGNHGSGWMPGGAGGQQLQGLTENTVINNYYEPESAASDDYLTSAVDDSASSSDDSSWI
jgi:hypothetical protein